MHLVTRTSSAGRHGRIFLSFQYALYFGVLGLYLPYFNLYCYHLDFSGFEIGLLSAVRTLATVMFPLVWGAVADRFRMRRPIYIFCNCVSAIVWGGFLLTTRFQWMLVISVVYGIFYAPIIAFLEAFTMDVLGSERREYGRIRLWGSIFFITAVVGVGRLLDIFSVKMIVSLILAGSLLQAVISFGIPRTDTSGAKSGRTEFADLVNSRTLVFLLCAFLMLVCHGTYYGFFSIHLEKLGFDKTFVGIAWGLGSAAEILVMVKSAPLFNRFSVEKMLLLSFGAAILRWLILATATSAPVILLSQLLHAMTYGTFHIASILYIDQLVPPEMKTFGQAVNNAATYGLGISMGFLLNGYLFDRIGSTALFFTSAVIAAAALIIFAVSTAAGKEIKPT